MVNQWRINGDKPSGEHAEIQYQCLHGIQWAYVTQMNVPFPSSLLKGANPLSLCLIHIIRAKQL